MSLLKNLTTDDSIKNEKDTVGGFGPLDSNVYRATISLAFLQKAASEALALVIHAKTEDGREVRQSLWMTSGKDKGCKNFYEKDGVKNYLPGFLIANSLALLGAGKEISELDTEEKTVKLYSSEAKAEIPTKVNVVTDLLGKEVLLGVVKQLVDKTAKNENTGVYEPTGETRYENEIDKVFRARDGMTTAEIRAGAETAAFLETWKGKWIGQERNKAKGVAGVAGAPKAASGTAAAAAGGSKKPTTSLFA